MAEQGWTTADFAFDLPDAQIAQHPLDVAGSGELARLTRFVADLQHPEFDCRIDCDVHDLYATIAVP